MSDIRTKTQEFITSYKWYSPLSIYHITFFVILLVTMPFNHWFLGWDAVNPELNFGVNFARTLSGFWQENYGAGLLGGHGFSALLPHTLILYILSFVIPQMLLRSIFTFLCFYLGGLGMYYLVHMLLNTLCHPELLPAGRQGVSGSHTENNGMLKLVQHDKVVPYLALFAAFFYMFNLGTIQTFYVQLEAFIVHFAALPWLFLSIYHMLEKPTMKRILLFVLINFFTSVQGFIPVLFVAYGITLVLFLGVYCLQSFFTYKTLSFRTKVRNPLGVNSRGEPMGSLANARDDTTSGLTAIKRASLILFLTGIVNSYWLIPLAYYQLTQSKIFLNAYNNLISTPHFVGINKKYGDWFDVALLRSFMFDSFELGGKTLGAWVTHQSNPLVVIIGLLLFALSLVGLVVTFIYLRRWKGLAFTALFIYFFISLTTATPPFSYFTDLMQHVSSTYYQAFRTSFTKFNTGLAFSYSIFLSVGLLYALSFLARYTKHDTPQISKQTPHHFSIGLGSLKFVLPGIPAVRIPHYDLTTTTIIISFIALFFYALPLFSGNLLYSHLLIDLPKPYKEVMQYFDDQPDGRIADFPQDCSEGWYAYNWGYFGSGFYWYGIRQPIMARSFDVWSNNNENYYWEITQALRDQDYRKIDQIMNKYQVKWVLYDPNLLYCRNQRPYLIHQDFIKYLNHSPSYQLVKTFQSKDVVPIRVYLRKTDTSKNFVSLEKDIPAIAPAYTWSDNDTAFQTLGTYQITATDPDVFYPFRSLFTKRENTNTFTISQTPGAFVFSEKMPYALRGKLTLPAYAKSEKSLPVQFSFTRLSPTTYDATVHLGFPLIQINSEKGTAYPTEISLGKLQARSVDDLQITVNEQTVASPSGDIYPATFFTALSNTVVIKDAAGQTLLSWNGRNDPTFSQIISQPITFPISLQKDDTFSFIIPKNTDPLFAGYKQISDMTLLKPTSCNNTENADNNSYQIGSDEQNNQMLRLSSQKSSLCLTISIPEIPTDYGYIGSIKNKNVSGDSLRLVILNKNRELYPDNYVPKNNALIIVPPTFPTELGFEVHLDNISEDNIPSINELSTISFYTLPYMYLMQTQIQTTTALSQAVSKDDAILTISHPFDTAYTVTIKPTNLQNTTLILSQSFDPQWHAYKIANSKWRIANSFMTLFPFIFGEELKNHVMINNWENGWILPDHKPSAISYTLSIMYTPQYFQYVGYGILFLSILIPAILLLKRKK